MEIRMSSRQLRRAVYGLVSAFMLAGGCAQPPLPFHPREIDAAERQGEQDVVPHPRQPLPTTLRSRYAEGDAESQVAPATGPALGIEPVVSLTLREAVQYTVVNNPDVEVQAYAPAIDETRVVQEEARFDPAFFTRGQYQRRDEDIPEQLSIFGNSSGHVESDVLGVRTGFRQTLESGGEVELRYQTEWTDTDPDVGDPDPYYNNELVLQVTQPLLRNAGTTVNRARIDISQNNQQISVLDFRQRLEESLLETERIYWQLAQAHADVAIAEKLLVSTVSTADLLWKRRTQDVTRVQISQANSNVQRRQAILIRARARARDLSDQLKRLMNHPDLPISGSALIVPASGPITEPLAFDKTEQVDTALLHRLELAQQALRVDSAGIAGEVARNNLLPQLNVVGSFGVQGMDADFDGAVDSQTDFENLNYGVGLEFEWPLGNRAARASFRRSQLQRLQASAQYKALVEQVVLEVVQALREVDTSWEEMVASRDAAFAAADALYAIQQREEANEPLTPDFVDRKLNQQGDLADAESRAAAALSNYNVAISRLEAAKGTLLRYNNVTMEEATADVPSGR
jgi:outer membrane protein TolC